MTVAKGFLHPSDYICHAVLEKDLSFERKFEEIHAAILLLVKPKEKKE